MPQRRCKFAVKLSDLRVERGHAHCHTVADGGNHDGLLEQRRELVAHRLAQLQEAIALHEALLQRGVDRGWGRPGRGLEQGSTAGQHLGVNRVRLRLFEQGFGKVVRVLRVNDPDAEARLHQGRGQGDPLRAGRLHDDEHVAGCITKAQQALLKPGNPLGRLSKGDGLGNRTAGRHPGSRSRGGGKINAHEERVRGSG